MPQSEGHYSHRVGWLRASVLGANDGIISTAALLVGVAAADSTRDALLTAGIAGLVAGAVSMALGEYVSVSSQRDTERSDIAKETWELEHQADNELEELTAIYQMKGLERDLAHQVAVQLTEHDALATHLRDELGIAQDELANPIQAAWTSAAAFSTGAAVPLAAAVFAGTSVRVPVIMIVTLAALVVLGYVGARAGGAGVGRSIARVVFGGASAMALSLIHI